MNSAGIVKLSLIEPTESGPARPGFCNPVASIRPDSIDIATWFR